jgi:hypothetical protein
MFSFASPAHCFCGNVFGKRSWAVVAQLESWEFVEMELGRTVAVDDPAGAFAVTAYDANHCPGN